MQQQISLSKLCVLMIRHSHMLYMLYKYPTKCIKRYLRIYNAPCAVLFHYHQHQNGLIPPLNQFRHSPTGRCSCTLHLALTVTLTLHLRRLYKSKIILRQLDNLRLLLALWL